MKAESLLNRDTVLLLALIAHELTVCARSTYDAGTDAVLSPKALREYNELQHRITGSLRDHILQVGGIPPDTIIAMVKDTAQELGRAEMVSAIERAKQTLAQIRLHPRTD